MYRNHIFNINFDIPGNTGQPRKATVHLDTATNHDCQPQAKRPEDGEWIGSRFLPEENTNIVKDGVDYTVYYCTHKGRGCMRNP